ncbi:cyclic nucleotide-binding domain-containing protein [Clostridium sp. PL3]|uniref:Cyclic nucleotide-binding domain-containing protein n=1 Tax=Clostridium thailandense TaxID=2794346 RepID=A0A949WXY2_9CLOT|nr:cyclic nucleotide-binding domain-containing protein [Clostridium thailandense]MBV7276487.1 cyclic nucleotide-binding domain-containing protein [Clostridium thailandense]
MKRINNLDMMLSYIEKYDLSSIFEKEMIQYMELFSFSKGELVCSKSSEMNYMYFLVRGKLKVYTLHDNGKSILLRFNKPLNILGDLEFLTNHKIQCNVESVNESIIIGIKISNLLKYAYDDSKFLRFVIKNLGQKLYAISNSASINLLHPLESRFASYLLSISFDENNSTSISEIKTSKFTELATLLGTSYRHLCRVINEFVSKDIIEKRGNTIIIKNVGKLEELSGGNMYE